MIWLWHHIFVHYGGFDDLSGPWYGFWSGFGGDLPIFVGVLLFIRHHNCHSKWCWRWGRHPVQGTPYVTCRHHHPDIDVKPTHSDIAAAWRRVSLGYGHRADRR